MNQEGLLVPGAKGFAMELPRQWEHSDVHSCLDREFVVGENCGVLLLVDCGYEKEATRLAFERLQRGRSNRT